MKAKCHHQTLSGLQKNFPKKINHAPFTIFYTENIKKIKGKTIDTTHLQPVELLRMGFSFCNVTSTREFTSIIALVCEYTRML